MSVRKMCGPRVALTLMAIHTGLLACAQETPSRAGSVRPNPEQRVVITVGELKITGADIERFLASLPPQFRVYYGGPGRQLLPRYLIQMKILAAEAQKQNLQDRPEVQKAIEIARESILADAARKRIEQSIPVSDQQLQELYAQRKPDFEEVRIRHILLRTDASVLRPAAAPTSPPLAEPEARKKLEDLRRRILAGADFAELAQAYSEDLSTAGSGGDMGYINRQKVVPPIADAAYAVPPGKVSDIIPTPYGLELIKVEDRRVKPLAEVRADLEAQLRQGKVEEVLQKLQAQYNVVVDKEYFTPPKKTGAPGQQSPPAHH